MAKIYIKIDIGRKSQGCSGVGICSIEIGAELRILRANQTLGTLDIGANGSAVITFNDTKRLQGISAIAIDGYVPFEITDCATGATGYALVPGLYNLGNGEVTVTTVSAPLP